MLYYNKIDIGKGIDPAKNYNSKECIVCHCWFFNRGFKFQDFVYNDLMMLCLNKSNIIIISKSSIIIIAIIISKSVAYRCVIEDIRKS